MAKYIAGDFAKNTIFFSLFFEITLQEPTEITGFGKRNVVNLNQELVSATKLNEENSKSFLGSVGWGTVGALALGPIGLFAGLLAGGNNSKSLFACELKDGRKFIAELDKKESSKFMEIALKNSFNKEKI